MRVAVLSDLHANLEALEAVLEDARARDATAFLVLGDIVGYGADPQAVLDGVRSLPGATLIAGNHDLAAVGRFDVSLFNSVAATAIRWTAGQLDDATRAELGTWEPRATTPEALLVHGSVRDPAAEYIVNETRAAASFAADDFALCFFGHTHLPVLYAQVDGRVAGRMLADDEEIALPEGRTLLNPGSVGQPRDGDPRASYLLFDPEARTARVRRVAYDIAGAQRKIRAAGLPDVLAERLAEGR